jgi:hypothetical protein
VPEFFFNIKPHKKLPKYWNCPPEKERSDDIGVVKKTYRVDRSKFNARLRAALENTRAG